MTISSTQNICGFIVLRKPEFALTELIRPKLRIDNKWYCGIDRLRWEDFDLAQYGQSLPSALIPIWYELDKDTVDFTGIKLLKDYEKAKQVLGFSGDRSEMLAIWSAELEKVKGSLLSCAKLQYLGVDCFALGEWSLLLNGAYLRPQHFTETISQLNSAGLLSSEDECKSLLMRYQELAPADIVEPIMENPQVTAVRVYRVVE